MNGYNIEKMSELKNTNKLIDISSIIDTKKIYSIDNYYDKYRVLEVINKQNKINLRINDLIFTKFSNSKISFVANAEGHKYTGKATIKFKVDKHTKYIVWLIVSLVISLVGLAILLPLGLFNFEQNSSNIGMLIASGVVLGIGYISVLVNLYFWPNELTAKRKAKLS